MSKSWNYRYLYFNGFLNHYLQGASPLVLLTLALILGANTVLAQTTAQTVNTDEPPAWVDSLAPETEDNNLSSTPGGQLFLLFDKEVNVATSETYYHIEKEITSDSGVQQGANLTIPYDPSYQKLIIHQVAIHRGDEDFNRLEPSKFRVIQQESDLDRQIYNGTLSALLLLDDVRVGDKIDYSYTLQGANPVLQGRFIDIFPFGYGVSLQHIRYRLLLPRGRSVNYKVHGANIQPSIQDSGGLKEYVWEQRDVTGVLPEKDVPSWYPVYPWLQVSEFNNWSEVAAWVSQLFVETNQDAPELQEEITKLRRPGDSMEQTVQNALDFAQNNVRYLGIEFGPNSYHPSDPAVVLQRRFGDCKDKAFLLCTLLKGLGYQATPILVNTEYRQSLPDLLPSPYDFNHVIVRLDAYGQSWWLDPTRLYQRGSYVNQRHSDYRYGLLADPSETDLTPIPASTHFYDDIRISETFLTGSENSAVTLNVSTTFNGYDAEWLRAILANSGRDEIAKNYLDQYAIFYPGISPQTRMDIDDFSNSDTVTLYRSYVITNFWTLTPDKHQYIGAFYPEGIRQWILKPDLRARSVPLEIAYPCHVNLRTTIFLSGKFNLTNSTDYISGPASDLDITRTIDGNTLTLENDYTALTNYLPVSAFPDYLNSLEQMQKVAVYSLIRPNSDTSGASQFNWPIFMIAVFYTGLLLLAAVVLYFLLGKPVANAPPVLTAPNPELSGLGGWLILVGLGLGLGDVLLLLRIRASAAGMGVWKWQDLTTPGSTTYHYGIGFALVYELLAQITFLILGSFLLVLFFQKRRAFPKWYIAAQILAALYVFGDIILVQGVAKMSSQTIELTMGQSITTAVVSCAIWIPYMCVSRRVKATFVR